MASPDPGSGIPRSAVTAGLLTVLAMVAGFWLYQQFNEEVAPTELSIATGPESDTYHSLGTALATVLENDKIVARARVVSTAGSVANVQGLGNADGYDLAFVQGDTTSVPEARLIAPLYEEALHIVTSREARERLTSVADLEPARIAIGAAGSGTQQLVRKVLDHFAIRPQQVLELSPNEAVRALANSEIDAAFFLSAVPSARLTRLIESETVGFLSLGDSQQQGNETDALALVLPEVQAFTIPTGTYALEPQTPVATVAVSALLVAHEELDSTLVRSITRALFEHRGGMHQLPDEIRVVAKRIREDYQPDVSTIPFHPGAIAHYTREEPPFLVAYAEAISLGLTVLVGLYSGYLTLRQWGRRRMKNRIDAYLLQVEEVSCNFEEMNLDDLLAHRNALDELRQRAFSDLVSERVEADESFTIFQNHLRDEFAAVAARIREKRAS